MKLLLTKYLPGCTLGLALVLGMNGTAKADSVASPGTGPVVLDAGNSAATIAQYNMFVPNTLTLNPVSSTTGSGFTQTLTFNSGFDGVGGPLPESFSELFTVGTDSVLANFTGTFNVSSTTDPDMFTLDPTSFTIDGTTYSFAGLTFSDAPPFPGGSSTENVNFTSAAATPEPSSLALLGTGILGVAGVVRKRFAA